MKFSLSKANGFCFDRILTGMGHSLPYASGPPTFGRHEHLKVLPYIKTDFDAMEQLHAEDMGH